MLSAQNCNCVSIGNHRLYTWVSSIESQLFVNWKDIIVGKKLFRMILYYIHTAGRSYSSAKSIEKLSTYFWEETFEKVSLFWKKGICLNFSCDRFEWVFEETFVKLESGWLNISVLLIYISVYGLDGIENKYIDNLT